jgi:hypothetical protein
MAAEIQRLAEALERANRRYQNLRQIMLDPHWDTEDYQHFISGCD